MQIILQTSVFEYLDLVDLSFLFISAKEAVDLSHARLQSCSRDTECVATNSGK